MQRLRRNGADPRMMSFLAFACQGCGCTYFTPVGMVRPDGTRASAVWCSSCQADAAEHGIQEPEQVAAVALVLAVRALNAALAARARRDEEAARPDRRPSRPARTRRGQARPSGARSRLG